MRRSSTSSRRAGTGLPSAFHPARLRRECAEPSIERTSARTRRSGRSAEALQDANFRSPYGKEVSKLLRHGIGIHHAGLLPKYRVLVEKLTQRGLLKVCVGRTRSGSESTCRSAPCSSRSCASLMGRARRILTVRDFKQICGRAGRRGFDAIGYVVAQAPEHVIANLRLAAKAVGTAGEEGALREKEAAGEGLRRAGMRRPSNGCRTRRPSAWNRAFRCSMDCSSTSWGGMGRTAVRRSSG